MSLRITKFVHSCLLVESGERAVLIDPGNFSWRSGLINLKQLSRLDDIVITHRHADHCDIDLIPALLKKFPKAKLAANDSVKQYLSQQDLNIEAGENSEHLESFKAPHEPLPIGQAPDNTGWHVFDELTHPGDSHHFNESKSILALPIVAPWGSTTQALELAKELKPKIILPIHDWHLSDDAKKWYYDLCNEVLAEAGIEFVAMEDGKAIEI